MEQPKLAEERIGYLGAVTNGFCGGALEKESNFAEPGPSICRITVKFLDYPEL